MDLRPATGGLPTLWAPIMAPVLTAKSIPTAALMHSNMVPATPPSAIREVAALDGLDVSTIE